MKGTTGAVIALSALVAISAIDIAAQDRVGARRAVRGTPGVEAIMGMHERLALTEDQLARLDAMGQESVQRRNAARAELAEVRSRFAAGQIERSEVMAFMEGRRDANQGVEERQRERLDAILTEAQVESLREARGRTRGSTRGRAGSGGGRSGFGDGRSDMYRGGRAGMGGARPGVRGGRYDRGGEAGFRRARRTDRGRPHGQ